MARQAIGYMCKEEPSKVMAQLLQEVRPAVTTGCLLSRSGDVCTIIANRLQTNGHLALSTAFTPLPRQEDAFIGALRALIVACDPGTHPDSFAMQMLAGALANFALHPAGLKALSKLDGLVDHFVQRLQRSGKRRNQVHPPPLMSFPAHTARVSPYFSPHRPWHQRMF